QSRITDIKFLVEHAVQSMGDAAAFMSLDFLQGAQVFAEAGGAVMDLLGTAIDALAGLAGFPVALAPANPGISGIKVVVGHAVQSIGDTAAMLAATTPEGFVGAAGLFADAASDVMDLMGEGLSFLADLAQFQGTFDLDAAREF